MGPPSAEKVLQALAPLLRAQMASGGISGEHFHGEWDDIGTPQRLGDLEARLRQPPRS